VHGRAYRARMPSQLHEALLLLFRNRPALAPELLRDALHMEIPPFTDVRLDSADFTDIQPAEYRADLVVLLTNGTPILGIVVEVQLHADERKRFAWPVYVANLRARLECPVCLLVVAGNDSVARWAAKSVALGGGNEFTPMVLGPAGVPEVTDEAQAREDPELAVLSAVAHGEDENTEKSLQIALAAQLASAGLDEGRSRLYFDLVVNSLSEATRKALQTMDPAKYEHLGDFARHPYGQGQAEWLAKGRAKGRAELIVRQLTLRFGALSDDVQAAIVAASIDALDAMGERLLTARTLQEALGADAPSADPK
jgi:hypothetical protein